MIEWLLPAQQVMRLNHLDAKLNANSRALCLMNFC
jgi:hypothetical protein